MKMSARQRAVFKNIERKMRPGAKRVRRKSARGPKSKVKLTWLKNDAKDAVYRVMRLKRGKFVQLY